MKYLTVLSIFSFGVIFQMIFNIPNRPWYSNDIYRGDTVVHKPELDYPFYTLCEKGKVLYIDSNMVAVKWENCKFHNESIIYDFHYKKDLELKYK